MADGVLQIMGATAAVLAVLHFASLYAFRRWVKNFRHRFKPHEKLAFPEKVCSSVHALFVAFLALHTVFWRTRFAHQTVLVYPPECDVLFSMVVVYQTYDLFIMKLQGHEPLLMWLHHTLALAGALAMLFLRVASFAPTAFAICELTVPLINLRWYAFKLDLSPRHWLHRLIRKTLLPLYWVARCSVGPLVVAWIALKGQLGDYLKIPLWAALLSALNVAVLSSLNVVWVRRIMHKRA